jgi:hypothetical protein
VSGRAPYIGGAARATRRQLALVAIVIVRWSNNLDGGDFNYVFEMHCTTTNLFVNLNQLSQKIKKISL